MATNTFFTIFWMIYFPVCIAFYDVLHMDWSDELLTLFLIFFALNKGVQKRSENRKIMREVNIYIMIMAFYLVYSLILAVNVRMSVFLDFQQQVRPYAVLYGTWLLNPQFTEKQKKVILWMMISCTVLYAVAYKTEIFTVTLYGSEESAVMGQLSLVAAMSWYLWGTETRWKAVIAVLICAIGILGGKSKFFGEMIAFVAIVFMWDRIKFQSSKTIIRFVLLTIVILFFTWTKFDSYYITGMRDDVEQMARPASYKTAFEIITKDYIPFGSGLGSFGTNAAAVYYSPIYKEYKLDKIWGLTPEQPMFVADAYYPTLAEYGLFGIFFWVVFWKRRLRNIVELPDFRHYKIGLMCIIALALEQVADTSYLSGKGMGYFILLAICLNSARNEEEEEDEEEEDEECVEQ